MSGNFNFDKFKKDMFGASVSEEDKKALDKFERYMTEGEQRLAESMERNGIPNYPCPALDYYKTINTKKRIELCDISRDGCRSSKTEPYQLDFDSWVLASAQSQTAPQNNDCVHEWKLYQGLLHDDYYCVKCSITRPLGSY